MGDDEPMIGVKPKEETASEWYKRKEQEQRERVTSRVEVATAKMAENAERVVHGEQAADALRRARLLFFAFVRSQGRIRVPRSDLDIVAAAPGAIRTQVQENGDIVVEYVPPRART